MNCREWEGALRVELRVLVEIVYAFAVELWRDGGV